MKITKAPKKSSESDHRQVRVQGRPARRRQVRMQARWCQVGEVHFAEDLIKKLKLGKHTFRVRAPASGLTGAAAKYQFEVKS